jgi:hypothetical protein
VQTKDASLEPLGYEQITGLGTVKSLTVPKKGRTVFLKAETQSIRWRDDGPNPTATVGNLLDAGEEFWYTGKPQKLRFIEAVPGAVLNANHYA